MVLGSWLAPVVNLPTDRIARAQLGTASIEFLDVGQGDAVLIRSPEGKVALVDAGPSKEIVPNLHARGIDRIDLLVLTHHHIDHYGGMAHVIGEYKPTAFLVSDSSYTSPMFLRLLKLVEREDIATIGPRYKSRKIELRSIEITVFPQAAEDVHNENNNSIGLRVQHGDAVALLTGDSQDAERQAWTVIARDLVAGCDLLELAHHGSRNRTDAGWLDLVKPKIAVVSCGRENKFGHPHAETVALLAAKGIPLKRTDQDGTVRVKSDGKHWTIPGWLSLVTVPIPAPPATPVDDAAVDAPPPPAKVNLNTATLQELKASLGSAPSSPSGSSRRGPLIRSTT